MEFNVSDIDFTLKLNSYKEILPKFVFDYFDETRRKL